MVVFIVLLKGTWKSSRYNNSLECLFFERSVSFLEKVIQQAVYTACIMHFSRLKYN